MLDPAVDPERLEVIKSGCQMAPAAPRKLPWRGPRERRDPCPQRLARHKHSMQCKAKQKRKRLVRSLKSCWGYSFISFGRRYLVNWARLYLGRLVPPSSQLCLYLSCPLILAIRLPPLTRLASWLTLQLACSYGQPADLSVRGGG